jgi:hypothetical protein
LKLEAEVGIEPTHKGFADPCLTTWLLRHDKARSLVEAASRASGSFRGQSGAVQRLLPPMVHASLGGNLLGPGIWKNGL